MILQALTAYYEQLLRLGKLSLPGWDSHFKVSYQLRIDENGTLLDLIDCREKVSRGKKEVLAPQEMEVPAHSTRSSGVAANFLCDNSSYMLGVDEKGKPKRTAQCFAACAQLHHELLDNIDTPIAKAILAFFENWDPSTAATNPLLVPHWKDLMGNANLVFCVETESGSKLATEDPDIRTAWQRHKDSDKDNAPKVQCLITGKKETPQRVHQTIKGVPGAQSSGAALVSFNASAFCSYGREQGENAPIGQYGAFAYTTALNTLLQDRDHCRTLGDTTIVCWAENAASSYASLGMMGLFGAEKNSGITEMDISKALSLLAQGMPCDFMQNILQPEQKFYVLGLAPNAARLSVRFFLRDSFGEFARHLQQHAHRLKIVQPSYDNRETLSIWTLAMETANRNARNPSPSPQLVGDLLRAVLTGGRYPATLLNGVTMRIRAEQDITRGRAAILKAYYLRNTINDQTLIPEEVLTVQLNEESNYLPYVLGRLFAVLEGVQSAANPNINTTIKDRYFNAASATPALTFPTLVNLAQKHLAKLNDGNRIYYSKQLTALFAKIGEEYPARMSLPEQGAFQIGYYHETQKRFTKKEEA